MKLYRCEKCGGRDLRPTAGIYQTGLAKIVEVPGMHCGNCGHQYYQSETILAAEKAAVGLQGIFRFSGLELPGAPVLRPDLKIDCPECGTSCDYVLICYTYKDTSLMDYPMGRCTHCATFFFMPELSKNRVNYRPKGEKELSRTWKINGFGLLEIEDQETED